MKKVCKLLLKCIIALIPLWVIAFYIAINPLSYLSTDSVGAYWNKMFTQSSHEKKYDVVILGDSMAATSFMPELLSDSTINLSLSGSSPIEGYYTFKDYLDNNEAPTDVFVSYMDYHLAHDDFTLSTCNQVHKFSLMDYIEIYKNIKQTGAKQFESVQIKDYWSDAVASSFFMPSEYIASIINSAKEGGRYNQNKKSYDEITKQFGRSCLMTNDISESSGIRYDDFSVSALQSCYYKKLIDLCEENQIKLHIIKLPLDRNTVFSDEYIAEVNGYYMTALANTQYAEFIWYPADYAVEWFWDDYHMNQHGSYRFSMQLKEDYPNIWGDYSATAEQMLAINNDIQIENEMAELFKWIDKKDYSVLIYSNVTGEDFSGIYNAFLQYGNQAINKTDVENLFVVTGDSNAEKITVSLSDGTLSFNIGSNQEKIDLNKSENVLNVIVIDRKNECIVTSKLANFDIDTYTLEELYEM